jgi:hypothetical protein
MKTDVNVPKVSYKQHNLDKKLFFVGILKATEEKSGSGSKSVNQWYGSADPGPYQDVTDPEH